MIVIVGLVVLLVALIIGITGVLAHAVARILDVAADRLHSHPSASRSASLRWAYSATSAIALDVSPTFRRRGVPHSRADGHLRGIRLRQHRGQSVLGGLSRLGIGGG